jgi:hypothetical protein
MFPLIRWITGQGVFPDEFVYRLLGIPSGFADYNSINFAISGKSSYSGGIEPKNFSDLI